MNIAPMTKRVYPSIYCFSFWKSSFFSHRSPIKSNSWNVAMCNKFLLIKFMKISPFKNFCTPANAVSLFENRYFLFTRRNVRFSIFLVKIRCRERCEKKWRFPKKEITYGRVQTFFHGGDVHENHHFIGGKLIAHGQILISKYFLIIVFGSIEFSRTKIVPFLQFLNYLLGWEH